MAYLTRVFASRHESGAEHVSSYSCTICSPTLRIWEYRQIQTLQGSRLTWKKNMNSA